MADYAALAAVWNATGKPAGVTGTSLAAGMTQAEKLNAINGWTVQGTAVPAHLTPSSILNTIVPADLSALTQLQVLQLTLLLSGATVDASPNTTIRLAVQNLFAGKTQTLQALAELVAPYDNPQIPWRTTIGFSEPIGTADLTLAGLS